MLEDTIVHCKTLVAGDVIRAPRPNAAWYRVVDLRAWKRGGSGVLVLEAVDGGPEFHEKWGGGHVWVVKKAVAS